MKSVRIIASPLSKANTSHMLDEIKRYTEGDDPSPLFILTPEQMTFHLEYQLLLTTGKKSMIGMNVVSFTRLAYRIFQELGGLSRFLLDDSGKAMLLAKIMNDNEAELGVFSAQIKHPSFIQKIDALFTEFKNYNLPIETLKDLQTKKELTPLTQAKLSALSVLYDTFNYETLTQYLTREDYDIHLQKIIEDSQTVKNSHFYIEGYHTFNTSELLVIRELAKHAKSLTITLPINLTSTNPLWQTTQQTYEKLNETLPNIFLVDPSQTASQLDRHQPSHAFIQAHFLEDDVQSEVGEAIHFFIAPTIADEIEEVAKRARALVDAEQATWGNIGVYLHAPERYARIFSRIFNQYDIPYFLDVLKPMMTHPVIKLLHQTMQLMPHFQTAALFDVFKTGLFVDVSPFKMGRDFSAHLNDHLEAIEQLENYALKRPLRKKDWLPDEVWTYHFHKEAKTDADLEKDIALNQLKNTLIAPLFTLEKKLSASSTIKEMATALFEFLEVLEIPQKLHLMETHAVSIGQADAKKAHEQVWQKLLQLLEQLVEVGGAQQTTPSVFATIVCAGLEVLTFATIPATLDGIQIGNFKRSRHGLATNLKQPDEPGITHAFIVGMNDGLFPAPPVESSLLTEKERDQMKALGIELAPDFAAQQADEILSFYTHITGVTRALTFSYHTQEDALPSYIYAHLKDMFPTSEEVQIIPTLQLATPPTTKVLFRDLLALKESHTIPDSFVTFFTTTDRVRADLLTKHQAKPQLDQTDAKDLYGETIESSVSRIEQFNNCEFAHFTNYGLKLKERETYEIKVPHMGTIFHDALHEISMQLKAEGKSFASLTETEVKTLTEMGINLAMKPYHFLLQDENKRMGHLKRKLYGVVYKTVLTLRRQGKHSQFQASYFEKRFQTPKKKIGDIELSLRGIIDRIDVAVADGKQYVRVVDYKSSNQELLLDEVYYGRSLQLLTYLDVAIKELSGDVGGALYFHVHQPYAAINEELLTLDAFEATLSTDHLKNYKMSGYLPEDLGAAILSDTRLEGEINKSDIVPITLKKDGSFSAKGNQTLTAEDFDTLRRYAIGKIEDSALKIVSGNVAVNPAQYKTNTACDWCAYRSVCGFDPKRDKYRRLKEMNRDEALEKIRANVIE